MRTRPTSLADLLAATPLLSRMRLGADGVWHDTVLVGGDGDDDGVDLESLVARTEPLAEDAGDDASLPEDHIDNLGTVEDVESLRESLQAAYDEARPNARTRGQLDALRRVAEAIAACDGRITAIETEEEAIEAELQALDAQVAADDADDADGDDGADDGDGDGAADDAQGGSDDADGGDADDGGSDAGEGGQATDGQAADDRVPVAARADLSALADDQARRTASSRRGRRRRVEPDTPAEPVYAGGRLTAGAGATSVRAGQELTEEAFGRLLADGHRNLQSITRADQLDPRFTLLGPDGKVRAGMGRVNHVIATQEIAHKPGVVMVPEKPTVGEDYIGQAVAQHAEHRDKRLAEMQRRTASGGTCNLPVLPDYSITVVGDGGTDFVDDVPTVSSNKPMGYYPLWYINQKATAGSYGTADGDDDPYDDSGALARLGMGRTTPAQDAAGYGNPDADESDPDAIPEDGRAYKEFVHIDCPPEQLTCDIEAVHLGLLFGHFQAMTHPEYVEAFKKYVGIYWDIKRSTDAIATNEDTFGSNVTLRDAFHRLLAGERNARHDDSLSWNVWAPSWFGGFLAQDLLRQANGTEAENISRATPSQAIAMASTDGIRLQTYGVESWTGGGAVSQVMAAPTSGAVLDYPTKARLLMYADGAVFKNTLGQLQIALRETLVKTNDFGTFLELFEQICFRGHVYVLDVDLCPNGSVGAPVALDCSP
jgi:hypothetical protein